MRKSGMAKSLPYLYWFCASFYSDRETSEMRKPDPNKTIFSPHKWDVNSPQAKLQALVFAIVFTAPLVLLDTCTQEDPNCTEFTALDRPCEPLDPETDKLLEWPIK